MSGLQDTSPGGDAFAKFQPLETPGKADQGDKAETVKEQKTENTRTSIGGRVHTAEVNPPKKDNSGVRGKNLQGKAQKKITLSGKQFAKRERVPTRPPPLPPESGAPPLPPKPSLETFGKQRSFNVGNLGPSLKGQNRAMVIAERAGLSGPPKATVSAEAPTTETAAVTPQEAEFATISDESIAESLVEIRDAQTGGKEINLGEMSGHIQKGIDNGDYDEVTTFSLEEAGQGVQHLLNRLEEGLEISQDDLAQVNQLRQQVGKMKNDGIFQLKATPDLHTALDGLGENLSNQKLSKQLEKRKMEEAPVVDTGKGKEEGGEVTIQVQEPVPAQRTLEDIEVMPPMLDQTADRIIDR